jgi:hypothetical protein
VRRDREEQRAREVQAGWGVSEEPPVPHNGPRRAMSKADRVLGRDPNLYADASQDVPMRRLSPRGRTIEEELDEMDEEDEHFTANGNGNGNSSGNGALLGANSSRDEAERRAMDVVTNGGGWGRSGASGMLRKGSGHSSPMGRGGSKGGSPFQDDGVD